MSEKLATAEWADPDEVAESFPYETGTFWLGRSPSDNRTPLGYADDRHVCLVSGSRGGKGTTSIVNNLCLWPGSIVVIDPKGENASVAAARRGPGSAHCEGMGQAVHVLDPFKVAQVDDKLRSRFNPLADIDPKSELAPDEAGRIAEALVVKQNPTDSYWDDSARQMLKTLVLHVLTAPAYKRRKNLLTVRKLITEGDRELFEKMEVDEELNESSFKYGPVEVLWMGVRDNPAHGGIVSASGSRFLDLLRSSRKQFETILQVVSRNTEFIDSVPMRRCLSASSFKLSDLKTRKEGMSLFLALPQRYMGDHFRWLRLIVTLVVNEMEIVPGRPATGHPVLMCLDEFAGLKRMEAIENAVAQIAGFGMKLFFCLQSLEQLKAVYPERWETFLSNCGLKLFFDIEDHFSRDYVSKFVGNTQIVLTNRSQGTSRSQSESQAHGTTRSTSVGESESFSEGTSENESSSRSVGTSESQTMSRGRSWGDSRSSGTNQGYSEGRSWGLNPLLFRNTSEIFSLFRQNETINRGTNSSRNTSSGSNRGSSISESDSVSKSVNDSVSKGTGSSKSWSRGTNRSVSEGTSLTTTTGSTTAENEGTNENTQTRPLITPDEIGRYFARVTDPDNPEYPGYALALVAGRGPAIIRRSSYYGEPFCVGCFDPHPDHPASAPPLLADDFHEYELRFPSATVLTPLLKDTTDLEAETVFQPRVRRCLETLNATVIKGDLLLEVDSFRPINGESIIPVLSPVSGRLTSICVDQEDTLVPDHCYATIRHSLRRDYLERDLPYEDAFSIHSALLLAKDRKKVADRQAAEAGKLAIEAQSLKERGEKLSAASEAKRAFFANGWARNPFQKHFSFVWLFSLGIAGAVIMQEKGVAVKADSNLVPLVVRFVGMTLVFAFFTTPVFFIVSYFRVLVGFGADRAVWSELKQRHPNLSGYPDLVLVDQYAVISLAVAGFVTLLSWLSSEIHWRHAITAWLFAICIGLGRAHLLFLAWRRKCDF